MTGQPDDPIPRRGARVLLVDGTGRILMFRQHDPDNPRLNYWITVGGGVREGETPAEAAVRELAEETGLVVSTGELGTPVWHDTAVYPFGGSWYRQEQDYFLVRVPVWEVDVSGHNDSERRSIDDHRWFSIADLDALVEPHYPGELSGLLREMLGL